MSEPNFTRGPWALDTVPINNGSGSCYRIGPFPLKSFGRDDTYACLYADGIRIGIDEKLPAAIELRANASLMAAAPNMYAALERAERKLAAYVGVCAGDKELTDAALPMARAALAKARGES